MTARLRVHVITEEDPFYLPVFFREFLASLSRDRVGLTGIDITPPLNQKTPLALARKLYRFYGPVDFPRLAVRYATAKLKDWLLPAGWPGTVARLAALHGVPVRIVANVNAADYVADIAGRRPDLLVSVAASQIFEEALLSVPRLDAINVHTGPLPEYRGMLPVFWQLHDGQRSIGITIHTMTPRIDVGDVLLSRAVAVPGLRTLDAVIRHGKRTSARALLEVLHQYHTGSVRREPMSVAPGRYRSFPGRQDAAALRRMGWGLL
jgi:methionyl-tRNA formyltransferase